MLNGVGLRLALELEEKVRHDCGMWWKRLRVSQEGKINDRRKPTNQESHHPRTE